MNTNSQQGMIEITRALVVVGHCSGGTPRPPVTAC